MSLFQSIPLASRNSWVSRTSHTRRGSMRLVDVLTESVSQEANLLTSKKLGKIGYVQQFVQALFADARQQYQQSLNESYNASDQQRIEQKRRQDLVFATTGLGLATAGLLFSPLFYVPSVVLTLYSARNIFQEAYRETARTGNIDYLFINALVIPIALFSGFIWAAALGVLTGRINFYLVAKTENRSKQQIADLFGGQIHTVWVLIDGVEAETPIEQVQAGDIVVVQAGQMIPVDGMITGGTATIDQHMLTGESQPVEKETSDTVLASTVVLAGRICVCVQKAGDTTVASQITTMLNQTTDFKLTIKSRTDRWLNQIMLPVLGFSALALPFYGLSGAVAVLWSYPGFRMILYGPLSMLSYLQVAAQRSILVKDGRALETLHEVDTVVFDKTGTLTLEQPTVRGITCCNGYTETMVLRYAAAAEAKQSHPIAHAILQAAADRELEIPALEEVEYKVGYGLKVRIEGSVTWIGSARFMEMEGINIPSEIMIQSAESQARGDSLVLVALDQELAGAIELQPTIRPEAGDLIQYMRTRRIKTVIISGDNETPTQQLAMNLGVDQYFAEVLPEDKAQLIEGLQEEGHRVCFIGDGINDSIALKVADVSVSLRGATTVATDMAQIVFMDGTLTQLSNLFALADEFAANMRLNFMAAVVPGVVSIAGTFLFGWGVTLAVLLTQGSTPFGLYNALKPLLDERKEPNSEPNKVGK